MLLRVPLLVGNIRVRLISAMLCFGIGVHAQTLSDLTNLAPEPDAKPSLAQAPAKADRGTDEASERPLLPGADGEGAYHEPFWLADPRVRHAAPTPDTLKLTIHGEYQLRYTRISDVPLSTYGFADYAPRLGQSQRLEHRLRFTPRFSYRDSLAVIAQFDVPHGMLLDKLQITSCTIRNP
jgi:hypothetical protein